MSRQSNKIVIVEDEIAIAQTISRLLEESGFATQHFTRGQDLLAHLRRDSPALAVIDLGLPDGDGLELLRRVQADHDMAVIILTGRGGTTDRVVGLELGADDYIVKPFEPRELVARVKAVLRRFERRKDDDMTAPAQNARVSWAGPTARPPCA